MLKLRIYCTRFESNYSSSTCKSNENIYSSSGDAQAKGKRGDEEEMNSVYHKIDGFLSFTPPSLCKKIYYVKKKSHCVSD